MELLLAVLIIAVMWAAPIGALKLLDLHTARSKSWNEV